MRVYRIFAVLLTPIAIANQVKVYDVEYVKEGSDYYLRCFIDKEGGVGISDCENISRALDPILDEADPIPDSYVFEVGSAGAERELKRPSDFEKYNGHEIEVKLYQPYEGKKSFVGTLDKYDNGDVTVSGVELKKAQIAQVKLHISI